jgi:hypothetical protein
MSRSESRIEVGLSRLVEHMVPVYADDDEDTVNDRLDEAYTHAHEIIDRHATRSPSSLEPRLTFQQRRRFRSERRCSPCRRPHKEKALVSKSCSDTILKTNCN